VLYAAALVPVTLVPTVIAMAGRVYFAGALLLGLAFLGLTLRFARSRSVRDARAVFLGSICYLPLLWILMIADRL
jgi:protoheme IX farnesyltransferase